MGARGAIIMSFFGAVFASMTLALQMDCRGSLLFSPFILTMGVFIFSIHTIRLPGEGIVPSGPARRVILWSTLGEGIGIFIAANVAINLGYSHILLPVIALIVGLHFLPMGYGIPFPQFYLMGSLIILSGLVGLAVNQPLGGAISGFWSAIVLLLASALAVHRDRSARVASPSAIRDASLDQ